MDRMRRKRGKKKNDEERVNAREHLCKCLSLSVGHLALKVEVAFVTNDDYPRVTVQVLHTEYLNYQVMKGYRRDRVRELGLREKCTRMRWGGAFELGFGLGGGEG